MTLPFLWEALRDKHSRRREQKMQRPSGGKEFESLPEGPLWLATGNEGLRVGEAGEAGLCREALGGQEGAFGGHERPSLI